MAYLTPARFRTMGAGSDLSGVEDWELRAILESASASVDAYCQVPMLPTRYSFLGGTMTNEEHVLGDSRRVYLRSRPIKAINALRIYATNTQYLDVNTARIYVEDEAGWVEIVEASLTSIGLWGAAMVPGIGLQDHIVRVTYTYGWTFPVTGEYLTHVGNSVFQALNQFWTNDTARIYKNGVLQTSGFTVDRTEGTVTFSPVLTPSDIVTADYTHTLPWEIARATAMVGAAMISERDLIAKGLGQLAEIAVEEVRLRRDARKTGTVVAADIIPDSAAVLLHGFKYITVR